MSEFLKSASQVSVGGFIFLCGLCEGSFEQTALLLTEVWKPVLQLFQLQCMSLCKRFAHRVPRAVVTWCAQNKLGQESHLPDLSLAKKSEGFEGSLDSC